MAKPEEFVVQIEPDGKIVLEMNGVREESMQRIMQLLQETVGPTQELEQAPGDPPQRRLSAQHEDEAQDEDTLRLERNG